MSARLLDEARTEARSVSEVELKAAQGEVEALLARRDFLESDVDQLEHFLVDQRDRLRQAASSLLDMSERVPGGLGDVRRPLLSASDDSAPPLESRSAAPTWRPKVALMWRLHPRLEPSLPDDDNGAFTAGDDVTVDDAELPGHPASSEPAGDDSVATTPWAAEPDDEPQFRFGLGETRRYE